MRISVPGTADTTLAAGRGGRLTSGLVVLAAASLGAALVLPVASVSGLIFTRELSLAGVLRDLFAEGEFLLFALVATFTVAFPAAKLVLLGHVLHRADPRTPGFGRALGLLEATGKWSMVDVMVVALTIVALKAHLLASMATGPGLYFFVGFIALSSLALARVRRAACHLHRDGAAGKAAHRPDARC